MVEDLVYKLKDVSVPCQCGTGQKGRGPVMSVHDESVMSNWRLNDWTDSLSWEPTERSQPTHLTHANALCVCVCVRECGRVRVWLWTQFSWFPTPQNPPLPGPSPPRVNLLPDHLGGRADALTPCEHHHHHNTGAHLDTSKHFRSYSCLLCVHLCHDEYIHSEVLLKNMHVPVIEETCTSLSTTALSNILYSKQQLSYLNVVC